MEPAAKGLCLYFFIFSKREQISTFPFVFVHDDRSRHSVPGVYRNNTKPDYQDPECLWKSSDALLCLAFLSHPPVGSIGFLLAGFRRQRHCSAPQSFLFQARWTWF